MQQRAVLNKLPKLRNSVIGYSTDQLIKLNIKREEGFLADAKSTPA